LSAFGKPPLAQPKRRNAVRPADRVDFIKTEEFGGAEHGGFNPLAFARRRNDGDPLHARDLRGNGQHQQGRDQRRRASWYIKPRHLDRRHPALRLGPGQVSTSTLR
jgi:hypothetical protein